MKSISMSLAVFILFAQSIAAQKKAELNLSDAMQVDSSDYFIIPRLVDSYDRSLYGNGKGYMPWNNYSNIYFYNTTTNESKKLFGNTLVLIVPFITGNFSKDPSPQYPANLLDKHIVYLARTENYNRDNAIDSQDPVYFYISDKTGNNLKQITPQGMNVVSWVTSKDRKIILVKLQIDKNGNRKFGEGDDDVYYRIDLKDDISQIEARQVKLQDQ
jgi:hypothetical protein